MPMVGALIPLLFFGMWWVLVAPIAYWLLKRTLTLLPSEASVARAKEREREGLFFLSALGGSLKAGLPLLPALANVATLLTSSLKSDIEKVYSLLLLGAETKQAWLMTHNLAPVPAQLHVPSLRGARLPLSSIE